MKKLKVYGWYGTRREAPWRNGQRGQTREIVAAHSGAEAARIAGAKRPSQLWNFCETGNALELKTALAKPGVVFWRAQDDYSNGAYTETLAAPVVL